ncbi:MAG: hypothetical protein SV062_01615 [Thermodesulfobacteriota bacterium]|nr:hypothetical protein [Thermodesulfobacteriota bacterium]
MEETGSQYNIVAYVDDLEEAERLAKKNNISKGVIAGINSVHGDMIELEPLLKTEAQQKRLKADVEKLVADLLASCRKGDEGMSLGNMRQLRDRVGALKVIFTKE